MTRAKVKLDFIENMTKRKTSYKKRHKGLLSKAHELNTLCDVELSIVIYSPYHDAPKVFPNHEATINTFTKFKEVPTSIRSSNMTTQEKITKQRIQKIEKQLGKVRKENRIMELTNQMYELLNGKDIPTNMQPSDLNNLSYIVNQHIKQVHDSIKAEAHEESHAPQPISGVTSFDMPRAPLLASVGDLSQLPSSFSSHMFPLIPHQRDLHPIPPTTMAPSAANDPPMSTLVFPPIAPGIHIPSINASMPIDNNQNRSFHIPQSPSFSQLLSLSDDDIRTLLDDTSFNINAQDPNHNL